MTIRHLKMFVTVCECGGVTRAAEQLYVAQPSVSHAIAELESYYNVKLFDRSNQRLFLTETGKELLVTAKEILAGFDSFEQLAALGGQSARVSIGASLTLGQTVIPSYLEALRSRHAEIDARVTIQTATNIQSEIENGNLDFAIVEGEVASPYLRTTLFSHDRIVAVASADYAIPDTLSVEELASYPLLLRDHGNASRNFFEKALSDKSVHIQPLLESVNDQALITAVYASLGIALLPESFVRGHIARGKFKEIHIKGLKSDRNSYLIIHKNKRLNTRQQTAYDLLQKMVT